MEIYTVGFTQKRAAQFFGLLKDAGIGRLLDVRLNNVSQLAGFAKREDLAFFLRAICAADYQHELLLAPTQELLTAYKKQAGSWTDYERQFLALLAERAVERHIPQDLFATKTVLLCSEATPEHCHRRLVAEYLRDKWGNVDIIHL